MNQKITQEKTEQVNKPLVLTNSDRQSLGEKLDQVIAKANLAAPGKDLLVAVDIDGTITRYDYALSPGVLQALLRLHDTGTNTVIATGREEVGYWELMKALDEQCHARGIAPENSPFRRGYVVLQNGAQVLRLDPDLPGGREQVFLKTFDATATVEQIKDLVPGAAFIAQTASGRRIVSGPFPKEELWGGFEEVSINELVSEPVSRLTFRAIKLSNTELKKRLANLGVRKMNYSVGWCAWMDIGPEGINKATGIAEVCKYASVDYKNTMAIGDGDNDLEMIDWVSVGVAMGQGTEEIKALADAITISVEEGGVAFAVEHLLKHYGMNLGNEYR